MWFRDLIDIRDFIEEYSGQDIYIRLAASEIGMFNVFRVLETVALVLRPCTAHQKSDWLIFLDEKVQHRSKSETTSPFLFNILDGSK